MANTLQYKNRCRAHVFKDEGLFESWQHTIKKDQKSKSVCPFKNRVSLCLSPVSNFYKYILCNPQSFEWSIYYF